jgi:hypothetical protein
VVHRAHGQGTETGNRDLSQSPPVTYIAVSRCRGVLGLGLLPDGEAGARRRRSCVGVQRDAWQDWILPGCASSRDSTYPPVFLARLPLVTKPLWTFGFSDYEVCKGNGPSPGLVKTN